MKKRYQNFKSFARSFGKGMAIEWQETKEIPMLLLQKEYRKAGTQVVDICKMAALGVVWVIPGGAVLTAMIVKFSCKIRPSAFQKEEEGLEVDLCEDKNLERMENDIV